MYFAIAGMVAAGILYTVVAVARKRARRPDLALQRRYEARLLAACAGDAAAVRRLLAEERQRRPALSALDAARFAHARLKRRHRHAGSPQQRS
jgi:hypothetical protein